MELLLAQDPSYLRPGTQVGEWRVVSRRGRGGSGVVYRVEHAEQENGEPFALKIALRPMDEHFACEAEMLARVRHGYVPRLRDSGRWTGAGGAVFPYLVMQWVEGEPLFQWAERNTITSRQAMIFVAQVGRALAAVHAMGGVHRDVKGENVLVASGGPAMLTDFGSSTYRGARELTRSSELPGAPQYWSPEALHYLWRIRRRSTASYEARPSDDVYALGVMAYRLVTGTYPPGWAPKGDGVTRAGPVAPERLVTVNSELATLIRRMLSQEPAARGRAEEVAEALEQAAKRAGRWADQPIVRKGTWASRMDALRAELRRPEVAWMGWLAAAVLGGALALKPWRAPNDEKPVVLPAAMASVEQAREEEEHGGTAALGNEAVAKRSSGKKAEARPATLTLQMPKKPVPGQRAPPCKKYELMMNGGCWIIVPSEAPPCGDELFEWKEACYAPSLSVGRTSTSGEQ